MAHSAGAYRWADWALHRLAPHVLRRGGVGEEHTCRVFRELIGGIGPIVDEASARTAAGALPNERAWGLTGPRYAPLDLVRGSVLASSGGDVTANATSARLRARAAACLAAKETPQDKDGLEIALTAMSDQLDPDSACQLAGLILGEG